MKHLKAWQRYEIAARLEAGYSKKEIAEYLHVCPSTATREIQRNGYSRRTIYQYVWWDKAHGGDLYKHLRHRGRRHKKRGDSRKHSIGWRECQDATEPLQIPYLSVPNLFQNKVFSVVGSLKGDKPVAEYLKRAYLILLYFSVIPCL